MYRESHEDPEFPTWDEAPTYGWEYEYDDDYNEIVIDVHQYWIEQGRRINNVINRWTNDQWKSAGIN